MKAFESLARVGLIREERFLGKPSVGRPDGTDCHLSEGWRALAKPQPLYEAWGPPVASPWSPYHRPTLFASLDSLDAGAYPAPAPGLDLRAAPRERPPWAAREHAVMLDLPGEAAAAYAAFLAVRAGYQPVVTLNNWPHHKGVVDAATPLAALLHYGPCAAEAKANLPPPGTPGPAAPPVFVLDARRLGTRKPKPGDFDNRYYLQDSDLPTAAAFKRAGIRRVVYVLGGDAPPGATAPAGVEGDDLNAYLAGLSKEMGLDLARVRTTAWEWEGAREHRPAPRKTAFSTVKDPAFRGFRRSAAGGFGSLVPENSGGGGG